MANVVITVTAHNNTRGGFNSVNQSLRQLQNGSNGLVTSLNGVNNVLINVGQSAGQAAPALGSGGGGAAGGMAAMAAVAATLLPAIGALVPMMLGLGAAGGVVYLAMDKIKKEAEVLKGPLDNLKKAAGDAIQPGVHSMFKNLAQVMKEAEPIVTQIGKAMGGLAKAAGEFANSPAFKSALFQNIKMGMGFVEDFAKGLGHFTQALLDFGAKSQPTLNAFSKGIGDLLSKGLPGFFDGLTIGIKGSADAWDGLFYAINKLLPAIGELVGSIAKTLGPVLKELFIMIGDRGSAAISGLAGLIRLLAPVFKDLSYALKISNEGFRFMMGIVKDVAGVILNSLIPAGSKVDEMKGPFQRLHGWIQDNKGTIKNFGTEFANAIINIVDIVLANLPGVIRMFNMVTTTLLKGFGAILVGASSAFGWIPGIGGKIRGAAKDFDGFVDKWSKGLDTAADGAQEFADTVRPRLAENTLKMNIKNWKDNIKVAEADLKKVPKEKQGKLKQDISNWKAKIREGEGQLKAMKADKTGHIKGDKSKFDSTLGSVNRSSVKTKIGKINGDSSGFRSVASRVLSYVIPTKTVRIVANVVGAAKKFLGFAHGGIVGHAAEGGPRNNLTLVGEHGPELVDLAPGSHVRTNSDSRRIMSGGGGGSSAPQVVQLVVDGRVLAEAMVDHQRKLVKNNGGNVQKYYGVGA